MGQKIYVPNGAGVAWDNDMPKTPKRFQTNVELSAVHHFSKIQLSTANLSGYVVCCK
jgi:hypothetical protein